MLYTLSAERSSTEQRAANLALINSGLLVALVFGAPFGLLMATAFSWREVFFALALAFAAMYPINRMTWRQGPSPTTRRVGERYVDEPLRGAWGLLSCMALWSASVYAPYTLLATALERDYRLGIDGVAAILMYFGLGAAIGSTQGGRIADRLGPANFMTVCLGLMTVVQVAIYVVYPMKVSWVLAVLIFAFGLSAYGFFPALQACAVQRFKHRRPTVMGLISSCLYAGLFIGATAGGRIFDAAGMRVVIIVSAMLSLIGALLAMHLRQP